MGRGMCAYSDLLPGARKVRASDLDLLVTLGEGRSLLDLVGLKQDLEDLVHRPVDVVTEKALSPYLRERVLSEAVLL
jgi:predicted nucleotidyltransferase